MTPNSFRNDAGFTTASSASPYASVVTGPYKQ